MTQTTDVSRLLDQRFTAAVRQAFGEEHVVSDAQVRPADPRFGHYQVNIAMGLGKAVGKPPRAMAEEILGAVDLAGIAAPPEIAGPGFINLRLTDEFLAAVATALLADPDVGIPRSDPATRVVVDYSSPNLAKEMHVGHLRSTVIGDAIVRSLAASGDEVIRQNHAGDWGTQFGMLIEHVLDTGSAAGGELRVEDLNSLYQAAQARFEAETDFADRARSRVVLLQAGDPRSIEIWQGFVAESVRHLEATYELLDVGLTRDDIRGESYYNQHLAEVCGELEAKGVAVLSEGALCVFPTGFTGRDGRPQPLIIRKSDGGYGYATTDLAAIRHRLLELEAGRIAYVTDARQAQHFAMIFEAARMAGWVREGVSLEHVPFGSVLGEDGRPFKTRSGGTILLSSLVSEAEERAFALVSEKSPDMDESERREVARAVGVGAVKYADLVNERTRDYVFSWDRMLSLDGNTSPYLQYAYARMRSIQRRAAEAGVTSPGTGHGIVVAEEAERRLVLKLLQFPDAVRSVAASLDPHRLCTHLYELAVSFTHFYETCPVLRAEPPIRDSRLLLCEVTARVLSRGLDLLGIGVLERV